MTTLTSLACGILCASDGDQKVGRTEQAIRLWQDGMVASLGSEAPPDRPGRPPQPVLRPPAEMPRRRYRGQRGRVALLHAIAHIELNAIDLAWDLVARFAGDGLPPAFYDDWIGVAADEARHFKLLNQRLQALGASYGDLPAHDGLWEAAANTAHDILARLAVVPMVLEARGLDVTPAMVRRLHAAGDDESARLLDQVYREEIAHVAAGYRWFNWVCRARDYDPQATWHRLVDTCFPGRLKPPFNGPARDLAGIPRSFYEEIVTTP